MNRTDIAHQVSTTLGDHTEDFDIDAIVDDLIANYDGDLNSIDDFESQSYWAIVESHDTTARVEENAVQAHAAYLQAETAYKEATVARQVAFAKAIDGGSRGAQASLANRISLAAPTVKSIADRGRQILSATYTAWLTTQPNMTLNGERCEVNVTADETGGDEPVPATQLPVPAGGAEDDAAQAEAETVLTAAGWTVDGEWEQTDHGYTATVRRTA